MDVGVIVPAAGIGSRMGTSKKQYMSLGGLPVVVYALRVFNSHPDITKIIIVVRATDLEIAQKIIAQYGITKADTVIGGRERQDSVYEGLKKLHAPIVIVHDAVRPFILADDITRLLGEHKNHKAVTFGTKVTDTIKIVDDNEEVIKTLQRGYLRAIQTPQLFDRELLLRAHISAQENNFMGTDDASLVEMLGEKVYVLQGKNSNIKLTTPEDLAIAESYL